MSGHQCSWNLACWRDRSAGQRGRAWARAGAGAGAGARAGTGARARAGVGKGPVTVGSVVNL